MSEQIATTEDQQLTVDEASRFHDQEEKIASATQVAHQAWVNIGDALRVIRDERLYREKYRNFQDYCLERWSFDRQRAYQLIGSAGVMHSLEPKCKQPVYNNETGDSVEFSTPRVKTLLPDSEVKARTMMTVPEEDRQKTWDKAVDSAKGSQPAERQVRAAVKSIRDNLNAQQEDGADRLLRHLHSSLRYASALTQALIGIQDVCSKKVKLEGPGSQKLRTELVLARRYIDEVLKLLPV